MVVEFFSQNLSANFADNNNADLIISGTVNTRKISDIPNKIAGVEIYQVSGNATITVSNGLTGDEIVSKT